MRCILVTHTHWDREWYRTHQDFRGRLVDAVDWLLDLCAADPGYRFLLDGQTIVLEDYAEVRPGRRDELAALCRSGRIAIGPWYVQPDSLLPSGESHVRNLLEGRRVARAWGEASRVAYTPDSFGHPGQFPQMLAGFGFEAFVYWRGNGREIETLPPEYWWASPDGTRLLACHLARGYFNAVTGVTPDPALAARRMAKTLREQAAQSKSGHLLLMNGIDHVLPEPRTAELAEALAKETGFEVERGLLEDFLASLPRPGDDAGHRGELVGGRVANLLPGVWSTRTWIKLRNRDCERALEGWAEPWSALGARLGLPDERPSLRAAWRSLLPNHAHDSICGCSRDEVHEQMRPRFDVAEELADVTTTRVLERIAGQGPGRLTPWSLEPEVAVFNPSPHPRTDVVRLALDPHPWMAPGEADQPAVGIHPLALRSISPPGWEADGVPVRVLDGAVGRMTLLPDRPARDLEMVVHDVPAFGWKRVALRATEPAPEEEDEGREIAAGDVSVRIADDGSFEARFGERRYAGLGALEDLGDRGDTYDADLLAPDDVTLASLSVRRFRHGSGVQRLVVERVLAVPARLAADRERREGEGRVAVTVELRVAPGVPRVDATVRVENHAEDHRLRLVFPTGAPVEAFEAATTFDVARRTPGPADDTDWIHPAPATFPSQGWVHANGLTVVAPGLNEAEVTDDGAIALTVLRCVADLSRHDLRSRPGPAGPGNATPGAQCPGPVEARLSLFAGLDPVAARDAELGLRAVVAGPEPLAADGASLVTLEGEGLLLSALKPAEPADPTDPAGSGEGFVLRVLNPREADAEACVRIGLPFERAEPVRIDETPEPDAARAVRRDGDALRFAVPAHGIRTVRVV